MRKNIFITLTLKAYTVAIDKEQCGEVTKRFLSYSLVAANDERREEFKYRHSEEDLISWGNSLIQHNEKEKAVEVLRLNVTLHPGSAKGYGTLASAYEAADNKELAIKNYKQALQLDPGDTNARDHLKKLVQ
jgi:tetratricopeptide (TPR) repeat protein